jgi:hypothetical protein
MAFVWTLGIEFKSFEEAEICSAKLDKVILSDASEIPLRKFNQRKNSNIQKHIIMFMPENMQFAGNDKLISNPFFYDIFDQFYQFIFNLEMNFDVALFGLEGGDRILDDAVDYINEFGLGFKSNNIDGYVKDGVGLGQNYFDGLVLSNDEFQRLRNIHRQNFEIFKPGYFWLPVRNNR